MDPDPICPERLDPDPICPEGLDPDQIRSTSDRILNPSLDNRFFPSVIRHLNFLPAGYPADIHLRRSSAGNGILTKVVT